jgi:hypothetical protein
VPLAGCYHRGFCTHHQIIDSDAATDRRLRRNGRGRQPSTPCA